MSEYQVIARKWRPQCFADVVGQEHVVRTLRNAINSGRIAHAYLFVGPRGIGKTTLARIFAKALNCEHPENGEPCCKCTSCQELAAERSLDVLEIDAASRNSTVDMRELAENALTRPVSGKYKIYIIDEVHMLSKAAWNVLLKTVEEPPAHVKFIFATTEVHQVLPTIISRCQRFDLMPIPARLIANRLQLIANTERVAISAGAVNAIARAADGGMRDAQSLLDQMIAFFAAGDGAQITEEQVLSLFGLTDKGDLEKILLAILQNNPGEVVSRIAKLAKRGKNLETLFDDLLYNLRAIQLCTIMADPADLLDEAPDAIAGYRKLSQLVPADTIQILLENTAPVGRVLHDALNKQIYLETVLLKAMREAHAVRIGDILARLNQLRSAGELQFLDKLPVVEKNTFPSAGADVKSAANDDVEAEAVVVENVEKTQEEVPPVEEIVAVEEHISLEEDNVDERAVSIPEISSSDASGIGAGIQEEEGVAPEEVMAEYTDSSENEDLPPVEEAEEDVIAVQECDTSFADVSDAENDPDDSDESDDLYDSPEVVSMTLPSFSRKSDAEDKKESLSPDKLQRSIANEYPQDLLTISQRNPVVQETLDLFQGTVIDIHR